MACFTNILLVKEQKQLRFIHCMDTIHACILRSTLNYSAIVWQERMASRRSSLLAMLLGFQLLWPHICRVLFVSGRGHKHSC